MLSLVNTINDMIDQLAIFADEVKKVAREVGTEGKLGVQAEVGNVQGIWQEITCVFLVLQQRRQLVNQLALAQTIREHHGRKSYHSSARFRPNLSSGYGRRLHQIYHC